MKYAVWYASAGCLPDSGEPEFIGDREECIKWLEENAEFYERPDVKHNLYNLYVEEYDDLEEVYQ